MDNETNKIDQSCIFYEIVLIITTKGVQLTHNLSLYAAVITHFLEGFSLTFGLFFIMQLITVIV